MSTACTLVAQMVADIEWSICQLLAGFCSTSKIWIFAYVSWSSQKNGIACESSLKVRILSIWSCASYDVSSPATTVYALWRVKTHAQQTARWRLWQDGCQRSLKTDTDIVERATASGGTVSVFRERSHYARIRAFSPLRCALGVKGPLATTNDAHVYICIVADGEADGLEQRRPSSESTASICCGFAVQQAVQQVRNTSTT